ncbi:MAG: alpha/beta fold hydrolase BchO [Pseudomonadota bacterium]
MFLAPDPPSWRALGKVWPHASVSEFVDSGGLRWHVQTMGEGPVALLIHGTGASSHSWRDVMPLLAQHMQVLAIDLPGHAFTDAPPSYRLTLPRVARLVAGLLDEIGVSVDVAIGHSAGAAILIEAIHSQAVQPRALIGVNGAFQPFEGLAGSVFPAMAKLLFINPLTPRVFALSGRDERRVRRLIDQTGSQIDQQGVDYYHALMMSSGHIAGALAMMANWDLQRLQSRFKDVGTPTLLLAGDKDRTVRPAVSARVAEAMPNASLEIVEGCGHLLHEERPEEFARRCLSFTHERGVFA